jgi:hypothetical protein
MMVSLTTPKQEKQEESNTEQIRHDATSATTPEETEKEAHDGKVKQEKIEEGIVVKREKREEEVNEVTITGTLVNVAEEEEKEEDEQGEEEEDVEEEDEEEDESTHHPYLTDRQLKKYKIRCNDETIYIKGIVREMWCMKNDKLLWKQSRPSPITPVSFDMEQFQHRRWKDSDASKKIADEVGVDEVPHRQYHPFEDSDSSSSSPTLPPPPFSSSLQSTSIKNDNITQEQPSSSQIVSSRPLTELEHDHKLLLMTQHQQQQGIKDPIQNANENCNIKDEHLIKKERIDTISSLVSATAPPLPLALSPSSFETNPNNHDNTAVVEHVSLSSSTIASFPATKLEIEHKLLFIKEEAAAVNVKDEADCSTKEEGNGCANESDLDFYESDEEVNESKCTSHISQHKGIETNDKNTCHPGNNNGGFDHDDYIDNSTSNTIDSQNDFETQAPYGQTNFDEDNDDDNSPKQQKSNSSRVLGITNQNDHGMSLSLSAAQDDAYGCDNSSRASAMRSKKRNHEVVYQQTESSSSSSTTRKKVKVTSSSATCIDNETQQSLNNQETADAQHHSDMAFCCYKCTCTASTKKKSGKIVKTCGNSGNLLLCHNFCCHNIPKKKNSHDWRSPIQVAADQGLQLLLEENTEVKPKHPVKVVTLAELKQKLEKADKMETNFQWRGDRSKCDYQAFKNVEASGKKGRPLVVLDISSGIGTTLAALKRLGVAIKTYISVESDPIARYLAKFNNLSKYNVKVSKDSIDFVELPQTFKDIITNVQKILEQYGPIDLIVGRPSSNKHISEFWNFITKMQKHILQQNQTLFFILEAGHITTIDKISKDVIKEIPPIYLNTNFLTPASKSLMYWSNIPFQQDNRSSQAFEGTTSTPLFTRSDFCMPERYCKDESDEVFKSKTFHWDDKKIDDERMIKVCQVQKDGETMFEIHKLSLPDREKLMGFKSGYVNDALKDIYKQLKLDAFQVEFNRDGGSWSENLNEKYFDLVNCEFDFEPSRHWPYFDILVKPPQNMSKKKQIYYDNEKYGKYLLGKTTPIPTMEYLLQPLQRIYEHRHYSGCDHQYYWISD